MTDKRPHGIDLLKSWTSTGHTKAGECGGCNRNLQRIAITKLAYSFEECECEYAAYAHIVERLWHRGCFQLHEELRSAEVTT